MYNNQVEIQELLLICYIVNQLLCLQSAMLMEIHLIHCVSNLNMLDLEVLLTGMCFGLVVFEDYYPNKDSLAL
jgi:hypothetical protein